MRGEEKSSLSKVPAESPVVNGDTMYPDFVEGCVFHGEADPKVRCRVGSPFLDFWDEARDYIFHVFSLSKLA